MCRYFGMQRDQVAAMLVLESIRSKACHVRTLGCCKFAGHEDHQVPGVLSVRNGSQWHGLQTMRSCDRHSGFYQHLCGRPSETAGRYVTYRCWHFFIPLHPNCNSRHRLVVWAACSQWWHGLVSCDPWEKSRFQRRALLMRRAKTIWDVHWLRSSAADLSWRRG